MAANDIEVEIKVPLNESDFSRIKEQMQKLGTFVNTKQEIDEYFTPAHKNYLEPQFPFEWLRIRQRGGKVILNYKHFHPEDVQVKTHCDEFETEVMKLEQLHKIFSQLNFKPLITVDKTRETFKLKDEFIIALDTVKELGSFIEIESMKDFGGIDATRKAVFDFAEKLNIDTSKVSKRGYPHLLMEKKGLLKQ